MNFLQSLPATIVAGIVLLVILNVLVGVIAPAG
jgi:hypothetical protein